jgi:hypothetical protein
MENQREQVCQLAERNLKVLARAGEIAGKLTNEQVLWQPDRGTWSIGQVFEHLCVSCQRYLERMRQYGSGTPRANSLEKLRWRPSLAGWALLQSLDVFPRLPAPGVFRPPVRPRVHVLQYFLEYHKELGELLEKTAAMDWNRISIQSPVVPLVNMNIGDCFTILIVHAERHLGQIEKIRKQSRFPMA